MIRLWALFLSMCITLAAEIVAPPPSTFCGDIPVFCYGDPGECKGLFNSDGDIVREFRLPYKILGPYSEGLLAVVDPISGLTGYLDAEGRWALKPQWRKAYPFSSGRARFCENDRCGFIDKTGTVVIEPQYSALEFQVDDFDEDGYARFYVGDHYRDASRRVGLIDRDGKVVLEPKLLAMGPFADGVAAAILEGPCWQEGPFTDTGPSIDVYGADDGNSEDIGVEHCRWKLIDTAGNPIGDRDYLAVATFSEGLAAARDGEHWGFIDETGEFVIAPEAPYRGPFAEAYLHGRFIPEPFSEGVAAVYLENEGWSYVDRAGVVVVTLPEEAREFRPGPFRNGLAQIWEQGPKQREGRSSYVDRTGAKVFGKEFASATNFCHGVAQVSTKPTHGVFSEDVINTSGKTIFSWKWRR